MELLTDKNVVYYLLEKGLLSTADVVTGNLVVIPSKSRNKCWKVILDKKTGFFVKQPAADDSEKIFSMNTEMAFGDFLLHAPEAKALAAFVPQALCTDFIRKINVSKLVLRGEDRSEFHSRTKKFPAFLGKKTGEILATIHQVNPQKLRQRMGIFIKNNLPWIFEIGTGPKEMFNAASVADFQLLRLVQENQEFAMRITRLKNEWQGDCFLHGDMKWHNVLIDSGAQGAEPSLKFIDWELASMGDPCWDAAGILQSYMICWVHSFRQHSGAKIASIEETEVLPLELLQDSTRSFWTAYSRGMQWNEYTEERMLLKTMRYAAARIVQSCLESTHYQKI